MQIRAAAIIAIKLRRVVTVILIINIIPASLASQNNKLSRYEFQV